MSPHLTRLAWWDFPLIRLLQHFTVLCNGDWGYLRQGRLGKEGEEERISQKPLLSAEIKGRCSLYPAYVLMIWLPLVWFMNLAQLALHG